MADVKKFLDQGGVSTLWSRIATKIAEEEARAKAVEEANAAAAAAAQEAADSVIAYVGTIPETYTENNIVAYIQKVASETLNAASGNSSETAASVKQQLDDYKIANDLKVQDNAEDIAAIVADYLKTADKTELANNIAANADEILRIDNALKAAVENDGAGLDSIKELATWIEAHGTEAAGYAAAIDALELLVGDKAVATQIADAIAAENLDQYAKAADLIAANGRIDDLVAKVDTGDKTVSAYIADAIAALSIGDYAKAADLTTLAARVTTLEGDVADLQAADIAMDARVVAMEDKVASWDAAEANAKAYADGIKEDLNKSIADAMPAVDEAHQVLTTNADGEKVWEDKLCYTYRQEYTVHNGFTIPVGQSGQYGLPEQPLNSIVEGETYTVIWDGQEYNCVAYDEPTAFGTVLGNASLAKVGDDTGEPFFIVGWSGVTLQQIVFAADDAGHVCGGATGTKTFYTPIDGRHIGGGVFRGDAVGATVIGSSHGVATGTDSVSVNGALAHGVSSFAEGFGQVHENAMYGHAEGYFTHVYGIGGHAEGYGTVSNGKHQHVQGKSNIKDEAGKYAHIVGNGLPEAPSNAHTVDWSGNAWFSGDIYVSSTSGKNQDEGSKKVATEEYVNGVAAIALTIDEIDAAIASVSAQV